MHRGVKEQRKNPEERDKEVEDLKKGAKVRTDVLESKECGYVIVAAVARD